MNNTTVEFKFNDQEEAAFLSLAMSNTGTSISEICNQLARLFPNGWRPKEIELAQTRMSEISGLRFSISHGLIQPNYIQKETLPFLKWSIENKLEHIVTLQEDANRKTHDAEPQLAFEKLLKTGRDFLSLQMFDDVEPIEDILLSNFLNLETVTALHQSGWSLKPRVFDEKFHILNSQTLFMDDLRYFKIQCGIRKQPVSAAYIDIDNFKKFNTELTETKVDTDVLPRFMNALEGFIFGRGFAYREGGDEYLVILPSASHDEAMNFFESLRKHLEMVKYPEGIAAPTVSIGVCTTSTSSRLTPLQIQGLANKAKAYAKNAGNKNCVAGYLKGTTHVDTNLFIFKNKVEDI